MTGSITPEVRSILSLARVTQNAVHLGPDRLHPKVYSEVNKALSLLGGKWNTKAQAHLFPSDPRGKIADLVRGEPLINHKQRRQAFYTPASVAEDMCFLAQIERGDHVLEPSAGEGALASVATAHGALVTCVEFDEATCASLLVPGLYHDVVCRDFLSLKPGRWNAVDSFDAILMNPPFSKGQDIAHVRHAFQFLKPGGHLVAITSTGWQQHSSRIASREFREFVAEHSALNVMELPAGTFRESGTDIATLMLCLAK